MDKEEGMLVTENDIVKHKEDNDQQQRSDETKEENQVKEERVNQNMSLMMAIMNKEWIWKMRSHIHKMIQTTAANQLRNQL